MSKSCQHNNFNYTAKLLEISFDGTPRTCLLLEVTAQCDVCGEDFVFTDLEIDPGAPGRLRYCTHVSGDGKRAYLPIAVASEVHFVTETLN